MANEPRTLDDGRYLIKRLLGRGGAGRVYLAEDTQGEPGRETCAIKELDPRSQDPEERQQVRELFADEENYLSELGGYNGQIPMLYRCFTAPGADGGERRYIAQEYIEGSSLSDELRDGVLDETEVKRLLVQLLPVLAHIHAKSYIHRDITPSNIILRRGSRLPVLIDFGTAKEMETTVVATGKRDDAYTRVVGKKGYWAPEQERGRPVYGSDLYSLGVTAIQLLTGVGPLELARESLTERGDPLSERLRWREQHAPHVSPEFAAVLDRAVAPDVKDRYDGDARQMLVAVEELGVTDDELLRQRLGDAWEAISAREPRLPSGFKQCNGSTLHLGGAPDPAALGKVLDVVFKRRTGAFAVLREPRPINCGYYVSREDEYCPQCGAYNALRLGDRQSHLLQHAPEVYIQRWHHKTYSEMIRLREIPDVDNIVGRVSNWLGAEDLLDWFGRGAAFILTAGAALGGLVLGLLVSLRLFETTLTITAFTLGAAVTGALTGFFLCELINEQQNTEQHRRKAAEIQRWLHALKKQRTELSDSLREKTEARRAEGACLDSVDGQLKVELESIARQGERIRERLNSARRAAPEVVAESEKRREEEGLRRALQRSVERQRKYEVKVAEIDLLRRHNELQAFRWSKGITHENGAAIEAELEALTARLDGIYGELRLTDALESEAGKLWLARILHARKVLLKARGQLFRHMNRLAVNETAAAPAEMLRNLNLLNAYLCFDDFLGEYRALKS
ncbi:MAG TPA: protein kinase [Pyrinomonadaceae bacterium]|nr:protein kinase [Pyrinomonadaceae bacterium]